MKLILLEALGALGLLLLIVWWTMFHGRVRGELPGANAGNPSQAPKLPPANPERPHAPNVEP